MHRSIHLRNFWKSDTRALHLRMVLRILAVSFGGLHTYAAIRSQSMNADGISYLDIGDAYFQGDWVNAINPVWSPLYSWVLGFVNFVLKPSMAWEFPSVHIINFLIFVLALASFEFMWRNVRTTSEDLDTFSISEQMWWLLGYLLFIWTTLSLIQIWSVTPDMLMAVFVFLAAGLVAKIRVADDQPRHFLYLGLVLGLGYLSKTFMFSTALIFLMLAWIVQKRIRTALWKALLAVAMFLLISLPYVALISNVKGRLTIGEAGTVTYVRHVLHIPYPHWQGDPEHNIVPTHLSRVIHQSPAIYEFGEPIHGTYAIGLDPSYWYEGISVPFQLKNLLIPLLPSGIYYLELFFQKQGILLACVIVLYGLGYQKRRTIQDMLRQWVLVIPALAAFGLYALVLVEDRYIGVFILLFWADVLANIRLSEMPGKSAWIRMISFVAAIGLAANILLFNLDGFARLNPSLVADLSDPAAPPARPLAVAQALQRLGVHPGAKVGLIGYAYDAFWARLAKVRIVAEMLEDDAEDLWHGDKALEQTVLNAFADAGVSAVVAENVPTHADLSNWHQVENSNYYIYVFPENEDFE